MFNRMAFQWALAAVVVATAAAVVHADTETVDGMVWTYTVSEGGAYVGGGSSYSTAISKYTSGAITIPSTLGGYPVTSIGNDAFNDCSSLTSVTIPDSVTSIGDLAFYNCSSLTSVTIPDSVRSIGTRAFYNCSSLTSVTIGNSVTSLGASVFYGCTHLTSVTIPDGVKSIRGSSAGGAFQDCLSLTSITIPSSVTSIDGNTFYHCSELKSVTTPYLMPLKTLLPDAYATITNLIIDNDIYYIGEGMFSNLTKLQSLTLPPTVVTLDANAFTNSPSLLEVHFRNDAPEVEGNGLYAAKPGRLTTYVPDWSVGWDGGFTTNLPSAWQGKMICHESSGGSGPGSGQNGHDSTAATETHDGVTWAYSATGGGGAVVIRATADAAPESVTIPPTLGGRAVTSVGAHAFASLPGIGSITIPEGVESIGAGAFERCSQLAEVSLPSTLMDIGDSAFRECVSLSAIEIPASVTNIGYFAFRDCLRLESVDYADDPPHCDLGAWDRVPAFAIRTANGGFVTVVTDIVGPGTLTVPEDWALQYPRFEELFGTDFSAALMKETGKTDAQGNALRVWQDYVAGTDPTDPEDRFMATISMVDGAPVIGWTPELSDAETAKRTYSVFGKTRLSDDWTPVPAGQEADYNFFKVTVEMRE